MYALASVAIPSPRLRWTCLNGSANSSPAPLGQPSVAALTTRSTATRCDVQSSGVDSWGLRRFPSAAMGKSSPGFHPESESYQQGSRQDQSNLQIGQHEFEREEGLTCCLPVGWEENKGVKTNVGCPPSIILNDWCSYRHGERGAGEDEPELLV